ncbi:hypothetical protein [Chryseobacterium indologenes]|uniref:hypothetical protein n=1 Tax=Chryseobacterium indologenes TaxID=253 RepID=UPI000D9C3B24|nr:hypothetical protein DEU40_104127 [Chryseobacterium sp. AG844]
MKNSNLKTRKLNKAELKKINGGAAACAEGLCKLRGVSHFLIIGPRGNDGYCC